MSEKISLVNLLAEVIIGFIIYGALFFIPAGTFDWIEAWIFLILTFLYVMGVILYFRNRDPTLLQSRSTIKPEKGFDTIFMLIAGLAFFSMFLITAFTVRFQWSEIPLIFEIIGFSGILISFFMIFLVMRENSYASKRIGVQEGQKVISTGFYAYVRHPMYTGFIFMSIRFPIALGSLLAIPSGFIVIIAIAIRAYYEEKTLMDELAGYKEYLKKVRYRLNPYIF